MERIQRARQLLDYAGYGFLGLLRRDYLRLGEGEIKPDLKVVTGLKTELSPVKERDGEPLRIISWNIQRGYKEEEVFNVLTGLDFDILILQESPVTSEGVFSQRIAEELECDSIFYPTMFNHGQWSRDFSSFGQATLSRYPIVNHEIVGLPGVYDWEGATQGKASCNRYALYTQIDIGGKELGVYNIHLDPFTVPRGRLEQIKPVLAHVQQVNDDSVVVGGDYNLIFGRKEMSVAALERMGFEYAAKESLGFNFLDFDHIMTKGISNVMVRSLRAISGSDHKPLEVDLSLVA